MIEWMPIGGLNMLRCSVPGAIGERVNQDLESCRDRVAITTGTGQEVWCASRTRLFLPSFSSEEGGGMRSIVVVLFALFSAVVASAQEIVGQAVITDGDTIEIRGTKIRLWGIDAVESKQLCWDAASNVRQCDRIAANAVAEMIGRRV
ncbi:hypothetical protein KIP88_14800 [Bradyrhizobium sp. SRL28]|uniref:thermonuclease family protein n=1 Tax=Bradyrhizobium sp. SRL28 TaxID=2836178 RepID=UPI001BDF666B|nr:hypothetical protein [Bradyrhizobium sp. SRL28]MBT1511778.1 hypothetical protein [Bradyrhizobium sp. SRL28]